jgi:hypothetical protein
MINQALPTIQVPGTLHQMVPLYTLCDYYPKHATEP